MAGGGGPDFFFDFGEGTAAPADFPTAFLGKGGGKSNLTFDRFFAGLDFSPFWPGSVCFPKIDGKLVLSIFPVGPGGHMDWPTRWLPMAIGCLATAGLLATALRVLGRGSFGLRKFGDSVQRELGYAGVYWPTVSKIPNATVSCG